MKTKQDYLEEFDQGVELYVLNDADGTFEMVKRSEAKDFISKTIDDITNNIKK